METGNNINYLLQLRNGEN